MYLPLLAVRTLGRKDNWAGAHLVSTPMQCVRAESCVGTNCFLSCQLEWAPPIKSRVLDIFRRQTSNKPLIFGGGGGGGVIAFPF